MPNQSPGGGALANIYEKKNFLHPFSSSQVYYTPSYCLGEKKLKHEQVCMTASLISYDYNGDLGIDSK